MTVKEYLSDVNHWTKGTYARTPDGLYGNIHDEDATCRCLRGAILFIYRDSWDVELKVRNVIEELYPQRVSHCTPSQCKIVAFNDHPLTNHSDILKVLERACV